MSALDASGDSVRRQIRALKTSDLLKLLFDETFQLAFLKQLSKDRAAFGIAANADVLALMTLCVKETEAELDARIPVPRDPLS